MTTTPERPTTPSAPSAPSVPSGEDAAGFEVVSADAVLTARAVASGEAVSSAAFWAGLLLAAEVDTAGSPRRLPADMWPGVDPVVVQEIWDRACVVAVRAAQFAGAPRLHGDKLARLQGELASAGFEAMGGTVDRSRRLVAPETVHPADGEVGGMRPAGVMSPTNDTSWEQGDKR